MRHYTMYNAYDTQCDRAAGESSILVRQGTIHSVISLKTKLQAVAVRLTLHRAITLCSVYMPPSYQLKLDRLVDQFPTPFILMGDFNSHNPLWGGSEFQRKSAGKVYRL